MGEITFSYRNLSLNQVMLKLLKQAKMWEYVFDRKVFSFLSRFPLYAPLNHIPVNQQLKPVEYIMSKKLKNEK